MGDTMRDLDDGPVGLSTDLCPRCGPAIVEIEEWDDDGFAAIGTCTTCGAEVELQDNAIRLAADAGGEGRK